MYDETFAANDLNPDKIRLIRRLASALALLCALLALLLLWMNSPVWKIWLFDLGVAAVFAGLAYISAWRLLVGEAHHRRRLTAAVVIGVTCAAAALGVFAITLSDEPLGLNKLPGLIVIQLFGAVCGASIGFVTSFFAAMLIRTLSGFFVRSKPTLDGAVIGALSGAAGGLLASGLPHLGWWFVVVSSALSSFCGSRSAAAMVSLSAASQPTE